MFDWIKEKPKDAETWVAGKGRDSQPAEKTPEIPTFKPHRFEGEIPLPERSEAHETPRVVKFSQLKYGKLVEYPNGPIQKHYEHQTIGKSPDFPIAGDVLLSNFREFSIDDSGHNGDPTVNPQFGIVKKTIMVEGRPFIVCFRIDSASEGGVERDDRRFTRASAIAIPAEEWSVEVVDSLDKSLNTDSPTETNYNLKDKRRDTKSLDESGLSFNQIQTYIKDYVIHLLSGQPLSIDNKSLNGAHNGTVTKGILCCLPQSVAREMSFSFGVNSKKTDNVTRLSQGSHAISDVYKRGGVWGSREKAGEVNIKLGEEYMTELELRLKPGDNTYREILQAVETMPVTLVQRVREAMFGKE